MVIDIMKQTNRLIEFFLEFEDKPIVFIVTDNPSKIRKRKLG